MYWPLVCSILLSVLLNSMWPLVLFGVIFITWLVTLSELHPHPSTTAFRAPRPPSNATHSRPRSSLTTPPRPPPFRPPSVLPPRPPSLLPPPRGPRATAAPRSRSSSSRAPPPPLELLPSSGNRVGDPEVVHPTKYDVFISFRGADVRDDFLSHLYVYLNDTKKLAVYKDDIDLQNGFEISPTLMRAIEVSDVYVVILSHDYANSEWCLEELEKIFQCVEQHKRLLIPVTHKMSFSDFGKSLPSSTAGNTRRWRDTLQKIANLSGLDYTVIRPETELIKQINKAVFQAIRGSGSQIETVSSYSARRGLVGIASKMEDVKELWASKSDARDNLTIGLWGTAGIGKTTLAQAIFDLLSPEFDASCNVRDFSDAALRNDLFSKLLGDDGAVGTLSWDLMRRRLARMKALVVIDDVGNDVGNIGALKDLLSGDLFGPGSRIIVTGANRQLLKTVCHTVYEVKGPKTDEARRLFCLHAFAGKTVPPEYEKMVQRAIRYVGENPQALTEFGAYLLERDPEFWDGELGSLEVNYPNYSVTEIANKRYYGLSPEERDAFLDFACFSLYWRHKSFRVEVLKGGTWNLITKLADTSLISIIMSGPHIKMNPLLQEVGRQIVNQEGHIEKRSRLWKPGDVSFLFNKTKGTQSIEGIMLNKDFFDRSTRGSEEICVQADAFEEMINLRLLVIGHNTCNIVLKDALKCLPNMLRILEWDSFPARWLPTQFSAENLITLYLPDSKIECLWEDDANSLDLGNLKTLNLEGSGSLKKLPNLSTAKRLESIDLSRCKSLEELPTSFLGLPMLESLCVIDCTNLKSDNLEDYVNCSQGSDFLPNLKSVNLTRTPIQMVPSAMTHSPILVLHCNPCRMFDKFPVIPSMQRLVLTNSLIEEVVGLEKLTKLKYLNLSKNEQLARLVSRDFSGLNSLERIVLERCSKLSGLPDGIGALVNLTSLDLSCTALAELPSSIGDLANLLELLLTGCESLSCLPDTVHKLSKLQTLQLNLCTKLRELPRLPSSLKKLDAHGCKSLHSIVIAQTLDLSVSEFTRWGFGWCWKLDPVVCSNIVDKFAQDLVRGPKSTALLVPAKWVSSCEEGSLIGSNDYIATAELPRGNLKSIVFCVLLNIPSLNKLSNSNIQYFLLNKNDNLWAETINIFWQPYKSYVDDDDTEERLANDHLFLWSTPGDSDMATTIQRVAEHAVDGGASVKLSFRGRYRIQDEECERSILIMNCRVIPVYDDQDPVTLQGLYDRLCSGQ